MENAAEALKMAAWVLIFVVALSVSMNAFTNIRQSIDSIVMDTDRDYNTKYIQGNTDGDGNLVTERVVGFEAIIPTIYRAVKENIRIEFDGINLYYDKDKKEDITYIDNIPYTDYEREYFIKRIIFGKKIADTVEKNYEAEKFSTIKFNDDGLAKVLGNQKFKESLGVYYTEEVKGSDAPDAQKTEKRVITYTKI